MGFKLALIGCGNITRTGHGPALKRIGENDPEIELTSCCDIRPGAAEDFAARFGFKRAYEDMDRMLAAERPDAVLLAVPVPKTAALSIGILEKGFPLLLEKPPGLTPDETLKMIEAARLSGTPHQVAFNRRHMPVVTRFKELSSGSRWASWEYVFYRTGRKDPHYETTAIHAIDTLRFLVGSDYEKIRFEYTENVSDEGFVPAIFMDCDFQSGEKGLITVQPATGTFLERVTAHGCNELLMGALPFYSGGGSADGSGRIVRYQGGKKTLEEAMPEQANDVMNGYYDEDLLFITDIRSGRRPKDDLLSTLQSMEAASCIYGRKEWYRSE